LTSELNVRPETPFSAQSRWGVFGNSAFVVILAATSLSNIGFAMFDTSSGWLMTSLNPSPRLVSAVQIATTLPLFLLTLPAGALTDVVGWAGEPGGAACDILLAWRGRRARRAGLAPHSAHARREDRT
jgi:Transmembrane secretion effector